MTSLKAAGLAKSYKARQVVKDLSLEVSNGEVVGLLGPNGAGKTTAFYMMVGLVPCDAGRIYLGEQDLTLLPMHRRAQLGLGYLPQEASVFRKLSVEDNILAILETRPDLERAARERPLGLDDGVAFEERHDVRERSAAEDIDDERIRLAPVFPGLGPSRRDRRADHLQLIELSRVCGLVALSDLKLDPLQVVDHVNETGRIGERRSGRKKRERGKEPCASGQVHGVDSRTRISMRRFSAASGCEASLRRRSA